MSDPRLVTSRLFTCKQVAEMLQVSTKTVREWTAAGRIRAVRTHAGRGGRLRYREQDVQDFINKALV